MKQQFRLSRQQFILNEEGLQQADSEMSYETLANYPLDCFLTIVHKATVKEDGSIKIYDPHVAVLQRMGVTWKGKPVTTVNYNFPASEICAAVVSSKHPAVDDQEAH